MPNSAIATIANHARDRPAGAMPNKAKNGMPHARIIVSLKMGDAWAVVGAGVAVTVSVTGDAPVPAGFTVAGLKLHVPSKP
jgi:hypothetical protein